MAERALKVYRQVAGSAAAGPLLDQQDGWPPSPQGCPEARSSNVICIGAVELENVSGFRRGVGF
jgi:hypothetical protein